MPDETDVLLRELTQITPANKAAAKALLMLVDDGTGDTETAEAKQNTIAAILGLIFAELGAVGSSGLTMNTARLLGRYNASAGAIEEISLATGLSMPGGVLTPEVTAASMAAAIAAAVTALFENKGNIDCSANPNYPAATLNDAYRVSVAGRIGGASGPKVSVGDWVIAIATNAGGDHATVGTSWDIWEGNIPGLTADGLALIQAASFAAMRALLDLEAGTDFNTYRAELDKLSLAGSDIASASTTDLAGATGDFVNITGTTTITALGTIAAGIRRLARFAGTLTLTHNASSLILPNAGGNITTAAGDVAEFVSLGGGNWRCIRYQRASGAALSTPTVTHPWDCVAALSDETTDLTTGEKLNFRMPVAVVLSSIKIDCLVAPTGANIIVDVKKNGSTILSTQGQIDAGEYESEDGTPPVISNASLAARDLITVEIVQVGSSVAGKGLKIAFIGVRA